MTLAEETTLDGMPNKQARNFVAHNFVAQRLIQAKVLAPVGLQKQKMVQETKQSLDQWNSLGF